MFSVAKLAVLLEVLVDRRCSGAVEEVGGVGGSALVARLRAVAFLYNVGLVENRFL